MKKKLAGIDQRIQFGVIGAVLVLLAVAGYMLVVSPEHAKAAKLRTEADNVQTQIYQRRGELKANVHAPTIQTADLFRLARAMPDREDMPGIILTLSEVARSAGIRFDLIEPVTGGLTSTTSYQSDRIHLVFKGDFYGLSDFLYRLRSLVAVRNGELQASGRLFNVDTLTFNVGDNAFPQITAELYVNAYVYGATSATTGAPATTTTPPATTTTTTTTTTTPPAAPDGATAIGAGH